MCRSSMRARSWALSRVSISAASSWIAWTRKPGCGSGSDGSAQRSLPGGRNMKFADRSEAGRRLADKLLHLKNRQPLVLALPRGGVAVGFEIAGVLDAPLDIVLVRKIGAPWQPELALGAVTDGAGHETFIDRDLVANLDVSDVYIEEETARQLEEIERRRKSYCEGRPALVVLAVPVAPPDTLAALGEVADEAVCLETPIGLGAIGFYYRDFHQMSDREVTELLARAPRPTASGAASQAS